MAKRRLRKMEMQETIRTEFFSDAVFAITITLLALDLFRIRPMAEVGDGGMFAALAHGWPTLLAFAASFAFVAVTWVNHHGIFDRLRIMTRWLTAANLFLLATCAFVPWTTSRLAEALSHGGGEQEVALYAGVLALNALAWFVLINIPAHHPEVLRIPEEATGFMTSRFLALTGIAVAVGATLVAYLWTPVAATVMLFGMNVFYFVLGAGFEAVPDDDALDT